jgi:hypothetical protein
MIEVWTRMNLLVIHIHRLKGSDLLTHIPWARCRSCSSSERFHKSLLNLIFYLKLYKSIQNSSLLVVMKPQDPSGDYR